MLYPNIVNDFMVFHKWEELLYFIVKVNRYEQKTKILRYTTLEKENKNIRTN